MAVAAGVAVVGAVALAAVLGPDRDRPDTAPPSRTVEVEQVIDGDTVRLRSGERVRLIGIDTPERDECGYDEARRSLQRLVEGGTVSLVNPRSVQDRDDFSRLLRYLDVDGLDPGRALLDAGLAVARYDSRDGYDRHPREDDYRDADRAAVSPCEG